MYYNIYYNILNKKLSYTKIYYNVLQYTRIYYIIIDDSMRWAFWGCDSLDCVDLSLNGFGVKGLGPRD